MSVPDKPEYGEPWERLEFECFCGAVHLTGVHAIKDASGSQIKFTDDRLAARIVACVNFCRRLTNDQLESGTILPVAESRYAR